MPSANTSDADPSRAARRETETPNDGALRPRPALAGVASLLGLAALLAGACFRPAREMRYRDMRYREVHSLPGGRAVNNPTFVWLRDGVTTRAEVSRRLGRGTPLPPGDGASSAVAYVWQSRPGFDHRMPLEHSTVNRLVLRFDERGVLLSHNRTAVRTGGGR